VTGPAPAAEFPFAISELEAYFCELDSAIGVRGIDYRSDVKGHVFDSEASYAAHMRPRDPVFRAAVQKKTRVERLLLSLSAEDRGVLALAFTPRRFEWRDVRSSEERKAKGERSAVEVKLREAFRFGAGSVCLLALALDMTATRDAYLSHEATRAAGVTSPSAQDLLNFLEWELAAKSPVVAKIRDAAATRLVAAIAAFDALRLNEQTTEQMARARAIDRIARLRTEPWGQSPAGRIS
jgi:hypothetical protein